MSSGSRFIKREACMSALKKSVIAIIAIIPVVWFCTSQVSGVPCNTANFDKNSMAACDAAYPGNTRCSFWTAGGVIACENEQAQSEGGAPKWMTKCLNPIAGNTNDDCQIYQENCQPKVFCIWDPANGCIPGFAMIPPSYYQTDKAYSANCSPG